MILGKKTKRVLLHIAFWVFVLVYTTLLYGYWIESTLNILFQQLLILPVEISATYFSLYFLIPKFLVKKRYIKFFIFFVITILITAITERLINWYLIYPSLYEGFDPSESPIFTTQFFNISVGVVSILLTATAIKIVKFWYFEQQQRTQLEVQNQASELALLRSQINPHFLFNTLNNIHTLITKDSDKASDALLRLSEIMRYMLYEASANLVKLSQETDYLKSYIELQKIRLPKDAKVELNIIGEHLEHMIPPMLLISFVENAFKHGDKRNRSIPFTFELISSKNSIIFKSSNPIKISKDTYYEDVGGIGLKNVQRRLELIYKDRFNLNIDITNNSYIAILTLLL